MNQRQRSRDQMLRDDYVDRMKIRAYQRLVVALSDEKEAITQFGVFSLEAREAEHETARIRRNYNLWAKK